jgi:hypothetical protein
MPDEGSHAYSGKLKVKGNIMMATKRQLLLVQ